MTLASTSRCPRWQEQFIQPEAMAQLLAHHALLLQPVTLLCCHLRSSSVRIRRLRHARAPLRDARAAAFQQEQQQGQQEQHEQLHIEQPVGPLPRSSFLAAGLCKSCLGACQVGQWGQCGGRAGCTVHAQARTHEQRKRSELRAHTYAGRVPRVLWLRLPLQSRVQQEDHAAPGAQRQQMVGPGGNAAACPSLRCALSLGPPCAQHLS